MGYGWRPFWGNTVQYDTCQCESSKEGLRPTTQAKTSAVLPSPSYSNHRLTATVLLLYVVETEFTIYSLAQNQADHTIFDMLDERARSLPWHWHVMGAVCPSRALFLTFPRAHVGIGFHWQTLSVYPVTTAGTLKRLDEASHHVNMIAVL